VVQKQSNFLCQVLEEPERIKRRKQVIKIVLLRSIKHVVQLHTISSLMPRGCR